MAIEIQQQLESGVEHAPEINLPITNLIDTYLKAVEAQGTAPKTQSKYQTDTNKIKEYCLENGLRLTRHFSESHLYNYR